MLIVGIYSRKLSPTDKKYNISANTPPNVKISIKYLGKIPIKFLLAFKCAKLCTESEKPEI